MRVVLPEHPGRDGITPISLPDGDTHAWLCLAHPGVGIQYDERGAAMDRGHVQSDAVTRSCDDSRSLVRARSSLVSPAVRTSSRRRCA